MNQFEKKIDSKLLKLPKNTKTQAQMEPKVCPTEILFLNAHMESPQAPAGHLLEMLRVTKVEMHQEACEASPKSSPPLRDLQDKPIQSSPSMTTSESKLDDVKTGR